MKSKNTPKLPRFKMPPPTIHHGDKKKEQSKKWCRKYNDLSKE